MVSEAERHYSTANRMRVIMDNAPESERVPHAMREVFIELGHSLDVDRAVMHERISASDKRTSELEVRVSALQSEHNATMSGKNRPCAYIDDMNKTLMEIRVAAWRTMVLVFVWPIVMMVLGVVMPTILRGCQNDRVPVSDIRKDNVTRTLDSGFPSSDLL